MQAYSLSANMDKFKTNRFPGVDPTPMRKRRVLLNNRKPMTKQGIKEKGSKSAIPGAKSSGVSQANSGPSGVVKPSIGSDRGRVLEKEPLKKQQKRMTKA